MSSDYLNMPKRTETETRAVGHTPTPYHNEAGFLCARGENGVSYPMYEMKLVVGGNAAEDKATQAFIALACNSYDTMRKALEFARAFIAIDQKYFNDKGHEIGLTPEAIAALSDNSTRAIGGIDAALAVARGEKP